MARDDDDDIDDENQGEGSPFFSKSLLIGIVAGIIAFIGVAFMIPHGPSGEDAVMVSITAPEAPAALPEKPVAEVAATPPQETGPAPAADVPIVAETAIVITDAGLNRRVAAALDAKLPREMTMAISPYATDPTATASAFKTSGRDVWLQIAAQSVKGGIDPGPLAVASSMSSKENGDLIRRQINIAGGGVIGIFIPDDADVTGKQDQWRDIAEGLIADNRMILDATPAKVATSVYMQKSESKISAYLKADVVVTAANGPAQLQTDLDAALPVIVKQQQAIVVVSALTVPSVDILADWVKTLPSKGIRLVPASKFTGLTQ